MANYFLFGKYENGSTRNATADRTNLCKEITTKYGGKFVSCWALLRVGSYLPSRIPR